MSENVKIQNVYRLTPIQEGMVYHNLVDPDSSLYFCQISYSLEGYIDVQILERSMQELFGRHEMLRTSIVHKGFDHLLQVVLRDRLPEFVYHDLRHISGQERQQWINAFKERDEKRSFDLTNDVLMRTALIQTGETSYEFIWSYHHVIMDGWCFSILIGELYSVYNMMLFGENYVLPPAMQYANYVEWMGRQDNEKALEYWRNYLNSYQTPAAFPVFAEKEKFRRGKRVTKHEMAVSGSEFVTLSAIAKKHGSTLNTLAQALWGFLLSRYSGIDDVVFGAVVSGRPPEVAGVDSIVGVFINTIPVRVQFAGKRMFAEVIKDVAEHALASERYHHVSLADIQSTSPLKKDLFDHYLVFENYPQPRGADASATAANGKSGLNLEIRNLDVRENTGYPLYLTMASSNEELKFNLHVDHDYYGDAFGPLLLRQLGHLVTTIVTDDSVLLSDMELVSAEDTIALLNRVNPVATPFPATLTILDLLNERGKRAPENVAVTYENVTLTYKQLDERANTLAHYLRDKCAVRQNSRVALMLSHSEKMIIGLLGILKAGGTFVPIDPAYPADRKKFILLDASATVLVTEIGQANELNAFNGHVVFMDLDDSFNHMSNLPVQRDSTDSNDACYIIYTSGSTGVPKGVVISHRSFMNYVYWCNAYYYADSIQHRVTALFTSLSFDLTLTMVFTTLTRGATLRVFDSLNVHHALLTIFDPNTEIDAIKLTPSHISILDELGLQRSNVSSVIVGGEKLTRRQVGILRKLNPSIKIYNEYGPTEATVGCIVKEIDHESAITIGTPIANTRIYIVDEQLRIQPVGMIGEICIAGEGLAIEYVNRKKLTDERFVHLQIPGNNRDRVYRTGDYGRWLPNGDIDYIGRKDDQVKLRGYRIELGEIENVVAGYQGIQQAVAQVTNGADPQLVVYLVGSDSIDTHALRQALRTSMPAYMIPSCIVQLDEFPTTVNGKVDKSRLPVPNEVKHRRAEVGPPANETEETLQRIWQRVLECPIGVEDDFFEVGGHSLKMVRIISRIYKELKVNVPIGIFFDTPTIRQMAVWIDCQSHQSFEAIERIPEADHYEVSFGQRRLWLLSQKQELGIAYNLSSVYTFEGAFNKNAFESALSMLIERHEILRTVFVNVDGMPRQRIVPVNQFRMSVEFSDITEHGCVDVKLVAEQERMKAFDLERGPLFRLHLIKLSAISHVCIFTIPHIITDGWSMDVLVDEFSRLYNAVSKKERNPLAPPAIQYKDYAAWQARRLHGQDFDSIREYWLNQFGGEVPMVSLPHDFSASAVKCYERNVLKASGYELTTLLTDVSRKHGVSVYVVVLTMVKALLFRYTGQTDITLGTPSAGRYHADLEQQLGLFANTLPLRTQFNQSAGFAELVKAVKRTVVEGFDHEIYPFDLLVNDLEGTRDMSSSPLFDVAVTMRNEARKKDTRWHKLEARSVEREVVSSEYNLVVDVVQDDRLATTLSIAYNPARYKATRIQRMLRHFQTLLASVSRDALSPIGTLNLLEDGERTQVLNFSRGATTTVDHQSDHIVTSFEKIVKIRQGASAVNFNGVHLSYLALNEQSNKIAHYLHHNLHLKKDDIVGIVHDRSDRLVVLALAVLKAGAAYMPMDPTYPKERIRWQLEKANVKALLVADEFSGLDLQHHSFPLYTFTRLTGLSRGCSAENPIVPRNSDELAYVVFTSGSTGKPKGVMIEHRSLANLCQWHQREFHVDHDSRATLYAQVGFDACVWEIWPYLLAGAELYPIQHHDRIDPADLAAVYRSERISHSFLPTIVCEQVVRETAVEGLRLLTGGERLKVNDLNGWSVINNYGPSETTVVATSADLTGCTLEMGALPIGKPIMNTEVFVMNNSMQLQPIGVSGELYIGGAGVARGYVADPEQTADRFVHHPADASRRLYKTGDFAHWCEDGNLVFDGREDSQIKLFGHRIELSEIETHVLEYPDVATCVVTLLDRGHDGKELVAYYTSKRNISATEFRAFLLNKLPYYMVPWAWVKLDKLPVSENGKLDYTSLPLPVTDQECMAVGAVARDNIEESLVLIWEEVLRRRPVGIRDNFFQLGGNSLSVINAYKKIEMKFPGAIKISSFYSFGTIEEMGSLIRLATQVSTSAVEEVQDFTL